MASAFRLSQITAPQRRVLIAAALCAVGAAVNGVWIQNPGARRTEEQSQAREATAS